MLRSLKRKLANFLVRNADLLEVGWVSQTGGKTSARDQVAWLNTYLKNRVVRSVVNKLSGDVAKVKIHLLQDGRDGRPKIVKKHPFLDWMKNPWSSLGGGSFADLLKLRQIHYEMTGEAFWYFRDKNGTIESVPLVPSWVQFPLASGEGYTVNKSIPGLPGPLNADKMVWFRDINPVDPFGRGLGHATCLDDEVSQLDAAAAYNNAFFENGATPDAIVAMPGIKPQLREKVKEQWEARHQGAQKAHRTAFVDVETKVSKLGYSHKDLDFIPGQQFLRDAVLQTWGMPPEIMGINENSNKATAQEALDLYQENTILPRDTSLVYDLTRLVLPQFGGDSKLYLGFESPVRVTEAFRHQKHSEMFVRGATTRDEYRISQGEDPAGGERGKEYLVPANTIAVTSGSTQPRSLKLLLVPISHVDTREIRVFEEE